MGLDRKAWVGSREVLSDLGEMGGARVLGQGMTGHQEGCGN